MTYSAANGENSSSMIFFASSLDRISSRAMSRSPLNPTYYKALLVSTPSKTGAGQTLFAREYMDLGEHGSDVMAPRGREPSAS